jgi:hypothetical protein
MVYSTIRHYYWHEPDGTPFFAASWPQLLPRQIDLAAHPNPSLHGSGSGQALCWFMRAESWQTFCQALEKELRFIGVDGSKPIGMYIFILSRGEGLGSMAYQMLRRYDHREEECSQHNFVGV